MALAPAPDVAVFARPGWLVVRVDVTGVPPETVRIDFAEETVLVRGQRGRGPSWRRAVALPPGAWPDRAVATLIGGMLEIRVPVCPHDETMAAQQRRARAAGAADRHRYTGGTCPLPPFSSSTTRRSSAGR